MSTIKSDDKCWTYSEGLHATPRATMFDESATLIGAPRLH